MTFKRKDYHTTLSQTKDLISGFRETGTMNAVPSLIPSGKEIGSDTSSPGCHIILAGIDTS